jgi:uncharacterized membrane protein YeaQ/YmgE (transglycosylase-associated protein family)
MSNSPFVEIFQGDSVFLGDCPAGIIGGYVGKDIVSVFTRASETGQEMGWMLVA